MMKNKTLSILALTLGLATQFGCGSTTEDVKSKVSDFGDFTNLTPHYVSLLRESLVNEPAPANYRFLNWHSFPDVGLTPDTADYEWTLGLSNPKDQAYFSPQSYAGLSISDSLGKTALENLIVGSKMTQMLWAVRNIEEGGLPGIITFNSHSEYTPEMMGNLIKQGVGEDASEIYSGLIPDSEMNSYMNKLFETYSQTFVDAVSSFNESYFNMNSVDEGSKSYQEFQEKALCSAEILSEASRNLYLFENRFPSQANYLLTQGLGSEASQSYIDAGTKSKNYFLESPLMNDFLNTSFGVKSSVLEARLNGVRSVRAGINQGTREFELNGQSYRI